MKTTIQEMIAALDAEINWHETNPDSTLTIEYQLAFIKGLKHARLFVMIVETSFLNISTPIPLVECEHGYILNLCPICFPDKTRATPMP